jgi:hypothetical protein
MKYNIFKIAKQIETYRPAQAKGLAIEGIYDSFPAYTLKRIEAFGLGNQTLFALGNFFS